MRIVSHTALIFIASLATTLRAEPLKKLTVEAGKFDRAQTIVNFTVPAGSDGPLQLRGDDGSSIPAQINGTRGSFILDALKAGTTRTYRIEPGTPAAAVSMVSKDSNVSFASDGHDIFRYNGPKTPLPEATEPILQRGAFIHPLYTPSGKLLTEDYGFDHKHQHGIWSAWTKTEFEERHPDFWNMGDKKGRVDFDKLGTAWIGPVSGGFHATHTFIDMTITPEKAALTEEWEVTVYHPMTVKNPCFVFDLVVTQNAIDAALTLPKYLYGGVGFRGRHDWTGADAVTFLTSEGKDRKSGNESRARWVWAGGKAEDGSTMGIAVLGHPSNFRSPQPLRLHPTMPYFVYSPSQLGDWKIEKGTPYVARYRYITADGAADPTEINRLWNDYAEPPKVTVE